MSELIYIYVCYSSSHWKSFEIFTIVCFLFILSKPYSFFTPHYWPSNRPLLHVYMCIQKNLRGSLLQQGAPAAAQLPPWQTHRLGHSLLVSTCYTTLYYILYVKLVHCDFVGSTLTYLSISILPLYWLTDWPSELLDRAGAKKPPTPIEFNPADELHAEFIFSAANLRASMYGVAECPDPATAAAIAASVVVEKFRWVLIYLCSSSPAFYLYIILNTTHSNHYYCLC